MKTVGELTLSEFRVLNDIKNQISRLTNEIGALEIRKANLLAEVNSLNVKTQGIIHDTLARMGVEGKDIVIREDGTILEVCHEQE